MENTSRILNCIICDKEIKEIYPSSQNKENWYNGMFSGGAVDQIVVNYGSIFDGDKFVICICDECLTKKLKENKIKFLGSYM